MSYIRKSHIEELVWCGVVSIFSWLISNYFKLLSEGRFNWICN